jgi:MoaA/NifB/PqqE/SkfB family radical SAM enzyme
MNLKRIRLDPDGLIIQNQQGFLQRIPLDSQIVRKIKNNPVKEIGDLAKTSKTLAAFFTSGGALDAKIDVFMEKTDFLNRPLRIYYGIEPRCNLACKFCGPRDFHEGFSPASVKKEEFILKTIADAGVFQVQLTGGEVVIRGYDLLVTIRKIADLGMAVILGTNGVWRCIDNKDDFIHELASIGNIIQTKISIEGNREFHDSVRGRGTYDETVDTLSKVSAAGLNPRISATIFKRSCNKAQLDHLVGLAIKYKAGLQPIPLRPIGIASEKMKNEIPTKKDLIAYTKYATELRIKNKVSLTFNFDIYERGRQVPIYDLASPVSCGAPLMGTHVTHTGENYACGFAQEFPQFMVGKITEETSLTDIWLRSKILNQMRQSGKSNECRGCAHYGKGCWGGCWVMSFVKWGKVNGLDPFCLRYPKIEAI